MSGDLFSAGFAWDHVAPSATPPATRPCEMSGTARPAPSQVIATPVATAEASGFSGDFGWHDDAVASVASVADETGPDAVSQVDVARIATDCATPETAVLRGSAGGHLHGVADVASVAAWSSSIEAVRGATPPGNWRGWEWRRLIADARALVANWGDDLVAEGWSTLDVFGVNPDPRARRLDRVGLCMFLKGCAVEAIDANTALIRVSAADLHTFDRRLVARGGVPFWQWMAGCSSALELGGCLDRGSGVAPTARTPARPPLSTGSGIERSKNFNMAGAAI
jgi:hypothetical protein